MLTFEELAASRRQWISEVLQQWCRTAPLKDLREAEHDWINLAGRVDPQATLWTWAWSRFPVLIHDGMSGLNETLEVRVQLKSGDIVQGYPDNRASHRGRLVLLCRTDSGLEDSEPVTIDDVAGVTLCDPDAAIIHANAPDRPATTLSPLTPDDERV